jgi:hypothetical protein
MAHDAHDWERQRLGGVTFPKARRETVCITNTPRTDALASVPTPSDGDFANFHIQKYKEHSRSLERENAEYRELLRELLVQLCENPASSRGGNAPGHGHEVPGVWDSDNGELAGKPCAWCAVWARAVANGLVGSNA